MSVEVASSGHNESIDVVVNKTLVVADQGLAQNAKASIVFTLPAAAAGQTALVRIGKEGLTVSVLPAGTDTMTGNGFTPAAAKGIVFTNQPGGSYVQLVSGAATWHIARLLGTGTRTP